MSNLTKKCLSVNDHHSNKGRTLDEQFPQEFKFPPFGPHFIKLSKKILLKVNLASQSHKNGWILILGDNGPLRCYLGMPKSRDLFNHLIITSGLELHGLKLHRPWRYTFLNRVQKVLSCTFLHSFWEMRSCDACFLMNKYLRCTFLHVFCTWQGCNHRGDWCNQGRT